jgi:PAS domain S-box-containing protein
MATRKILIVDSDIAAAEALRKRLAALGYEAVGICQSTGDAATLAARTEPDLALVDVSLSGVPIPPRLPAELSTVSPVPVVVITADAGADSLQRAGLTEPHRFLVEPFSDRELGVIIELACCKHDAAREARALEDRFFALSIDMLCFLDFSGYFKRLNPAWERTLGFTRDELMSKPFIEFVHPDDRERTLRQNREVRGGGRALGFENRYRCKDGSYRWLLWNAAPDSSASVIYSVARDITARKQEEADRDRLVHELQTALAEVRTLQEILPICSYCRKIRDDENYWHTVENYIAKHTGSQFSHGICPHCLDTVLMPQIERSRPG